MIYAGLTGSSPVGLPARLRLRSGATIDVDAGLAATLQAAAEEALAAN